MIIGIFRAAFAEYKRTYGDKALNSNEGFVTVLKDAAVIIRNRNGVITGNIFLGIPYKVDCPYGENAEDIAFAELKKEYGDIEMEEGDSFVTVFTDGVLNVTVKDGRVVKETILGKALTVDKSLNDFKTSEIPEREEPEREEPKSESDMFHDLLMRKFF